MAERMLEVLRTEQKYLLSYMDSKIISSRLGQVIPMDEHGGYDGYLVRSLYFDTIRDDDYRDKDCGLEIRHKIRLRVYSSKDQTAKLELKEKQGDFQRKRSLLLTRDDAEELVKGNMEVLANYNSDFAGEMYGRMASKHYMPKCVVEYDRKAYVVPTNDIRITFDSNLRANENNLDIFDPGLFCYPVGNPGTTTMEVKFNNFLLSYVKDLVSVDGLAQVSASKYCAARLATLGAM